MFHIAIVDDDQVIHQKLEEMITSILFKYPIPFKVSHFFSGNEFLSTKDTFSLIMLDVEIIRSSYSYHLSLFISG